MQLIGMLDSPYVRRVAISMRLMGIPFEHRSLSVFGGFDEFRTLNPVVKAPTLICDDGSALMDSTLILDYLDSLNAGRLSLMPTEPAARQRTLRVIGLALAGSEKAVQVVYETRLRPADKQHAPWLARVRLQLGAALDGLEAEFARHAPSTSALDQAGVSSAVTWRFVHEMLPEIVNIDDYPLLRDWGSEAERHPAFIATPFA
ncbi:glutathione S-transferase [Paludibacterium yongneupense]|uniref:glutathione S-transferase n=1 Tax=Paludibacterium yongneupense TaxID=400061 RepID=UPI000400512A|nr:glutathione S-transferase [Paludibacterium yongneupense]